MTKLVDDKPRESFPRKLTMMGRAYTNIQILGCNYIACEATNALSVPNFPFLPKPKQKFPLTAKTN